MAEALFRHEPFESRRADFNVWGLCPPSDRIGRLAAVHRHPPAHAGRRAYDAFGSERYVLTFDNRALRDVAAWAPYEFLTILVNSDTYGGGGIFGLFSTVAVDNDWADYLFVHEFGHHFAALADEYYTSPVAYEPVADRSSSPGSRTSRRCSTRRSSSGATWSQRHADADAVAQGRVRGRAA